MTNGGARSLLARQVSPRRERPDYSRDGINSNGVMPTELTPTPTMVGSRPSGRFCAGHANRLVYRELYLLRLHLCRCVRVQRSVNAFTGTLFSLVGAGRKFRLTLKAVL